MTSGAAGGRTGIRRPRLVGRLRVGSASAALAAAVALALAPAMPASAHDYLVSSNPAAGSTVSTELSTVKLTFDDRVLDLSGDNTSNVVEVRKGGRHYENGCVTIADTDVSTGVSLGGSGTYEAIWQVVSADGHSVSNSITFHYVEPAGVTAAPGASSRPTCGSVPSGSASVAPAPAASGTTDPASAAPGAVVPTASAGTTVAGGTAATSGDLPVALAIGGGVIVLALLGTVLVLVRARRTSAGPPAE